jgi:hypothetical protein
VCQVASGSEEYQRIGCNLHHLFGPGHMTLQGCSNQDSDIYETSPAKQQLNLR